ncbi:hypothetical protein KIN20_022137 [Parelaphostrongylus tenuis]|uniref:Tyrosine specific protein phosphatases domain-containing protein n=1 Tax=Parelaphostrongylus tenuis TaxID=148309 RepID=A0AAD5QUK2_PARTN|nr:hypothetical protein KIN20_022137 [Parelaphostrongylus tenuis]
MHGVSSDIDQCQKLLALSFLLVLRESRQRCSFICAADTRGPIVAVKNQGCIYRKMRLRGHGKSPEEKETDSFVQLVQDFTKDHPGEVVGVHCTHGFNRTGFLIAAYLIIAKNWAVDHAILTFAKQRPCGIYKQEYLFDLFKRYGNTDHCLEAPSEPSWEYGDAFRDDGSTDPSTNEAYEDAEAVNGTDKTQGKRKEEELSHIEQPAKRPQLQNLPSD